jgi:uncharacterized tellurite resistance protein B-like protein
VTIKNLDHEDRLRLMRFVCSLAWADLEVRPKERAFVKKMVKRLHLDEAEAKLVDGWLEVPPPAEEVDPAKVPHKHRKVFLEAVRAMAKADGEVDAEESESLALLEQLLT